MTTWKECQVSSYWPEGTVNTCEVHITGAEIVVSYKYEGRWMTFKGSEVAPGHYKLTCSESAGEATLHRSGDSKWLEGY